MLKYVLDDIYNECIEPIRVLLAVALALFEGRKTDSSADALTGIIRALKDQSREIGTELLPKKLILYHALLTVRQQDGINNIIHWLLNMYLMLSAPFENTTLDAEAIDRIYAMLNRNVWTKLMPDIRRVMTRICYTAVMLDRDGQLTNEFEEAYAQIAEQLQSRGRLADTSNMLRTLALDETKRTLDRLNLTSIMDEVRELFRRS
ncbi:MAG: hypothetical protein IPK19_04140 [Chloroflexi bacterium]|nr:hypothetical protein [Chloroflexota bacterium]